MSELVVNTTLVWDPSDMQETQQAKEQYLSYRRQGYAILKPDGTIMERFAAMLGEAKILAQRIGRHCLTLLTEKGDERLVWDKEDGSEAKEAKQRFTEFIGRGYKAYSVDARGQKKMRITEFDVDAQEIIMVPATVKA